LLSIKKCPVPSETFFGKYSQNGSYVDCYVTELQGHVAFSEYVFAFYTTALFKLERLILKISVFKPSTDNQARELAEGVRDQFAAWHVEARSESEILLCDFMGRTRSWLKVIHLNTGSDPHSQLFFGSAVVPKQNPKTGQSSLGFLFIILLGFHQVYSQLLLCSARLKLKR